MGFPSQQDVHKLLQKAGTESESMEKAINEKGDPFADLEVEENVIKGLEEDLATMKDKYHVLKSV